MMLAKDGYGEYLRSEHWLRIREKRLGIDGYRCVDCGFVGCEENPLQVHHKTYDRLYCENIHTDLITLCKSCHEKEHGRINESRAAEKRQREAWREKQRIQKEARFLAFVWPKLRFNGGDVHPLSLEELDNVRKDLLRQEPDLESIPVQSLQKLFLRIIHNQIDDLLFEGKSIKAIQDELNVSYKTVKKRKDDLRMKIMNWNLIEENKPNTLLDPGGYVCRITGVQDVPEREYVWVMYDVAEGPQAGIYANLPAADDWKHRFTRSYKDTAAGMFKAFLNRLEESNRGRFDVAKWQVYSDERQFVGLEIGLVFGKEMYTSDKGEDKERTVVSYVCAAQDIRNGDFKIPAPKDRRTNVPNAGTPSTNMYTDVPF